MRKWIKQDEKTDRRFQSFDKPVLPRQRRKQQSSCNKNRENNRNTNSNKLSGFFKVSKVSSEIQEPGCSPYKQRRLPIFYLQVNTNPCGNTEEKLNTTIQRKT